MYIHLLLEKSSVVFFFFIQTFSIAATHFTFAFIIEVDFAKNKLINYAKDVSLTNKNNFEL